MVVGMTGQGLRIFRGPQPTARATSVTTPLLWPPPQEELRQRPRPVDLVGALQLVRPGDRAPAPGGRGLGALADPPDGGADLRLAEPVPAVERGPGEKHPIGGSPGSLGDDPSDAQSCTAQIARRGDSTLYQVVRRQSRTWGERRGPASAGEPRAGPPLPSAAEALGPGPPARVPLQKALRDSGAGRTRIRNFFGHPPPGPIFPRHGHHFREPHGCGLPIGRGLRSHRRSATPSDAYYPE
jgi:hypothetical protein